MSEEEVRPEETHVVSQQRSTVRLRLLRQELHTQNPPEPPPAHAPRRRRRRRTRGDGAQRPRLKHAPCCLYMILKAVLIIYKEIKTSESL